MKDLEKKLDYDGKGMHDEVKHLQGLEESR